MTLFKFIQNISKRLKIVIILFISVLPSVYYIFIDRSLSGLIPAAISSAILYAGMYWILDYPIKKSSYFTFMLFPSIVAFPVLFLINDYSSELAVFKVSALLIAAVLCIYMVSIYAISLSVNILNVATISKIPLVQAAHTVIFFYTFVTSYLYFIVITHYAMPTGIYIFLDFLVAFILLFQSIRGIVEGVGEAIILSLFGAFCVLQISLVLLSWRVISAIVALIFTVIIYIYQGIILHENKNSFTFGVLFEYVGLFSISLIILAIASKWGIAGGLF